MRLRGLQNGVAHRQHGCLLATSGATLPTGRWCSPGRASSPPPLGCVRFSAESRQNALGDFELIELVAQLCPLGIEPREPFGNPLLLLSNLVHRSHLLYPFSLLDTEDDVIAPVFSMEKCVCCFDDYHSEPLSMSAGIADKLAPIFLNMKHSILKAAHAKYAVAVGWVMGSTTVSPFRGTERRYGAGGEEWQLRR